MTFVAVSVTVFGVAKEALPRSNSTVSPLTAPDVLRPTRIMVAVAASAALRNPSESLVEPCSAGVDGALGAAISLVKAMGVLAGPMFPA